MKKYLSLVLACLMVLSSVAFAAPVAVGTVETAKETTVDVTEVFEADIMEETETDTEMVTTDLAVYNEIYTLSFENLSVGTFTKEDIKTLASANKATADFDGAVFDASGQVEITEDSSNHVLTFVKNANNSTHNRWYIHKPTKGFPDGQYYVKAKVKVHDITDDESKPYVFNLNGTGTTTNKAYGQFDAKNKFTEVTSSTVTVEKGGRTDIDMTVINSFQLYADGQGKDNTWSVDDIKMYFKPAYYTLTLVGGHGVPTSLDIVRNGYFVPTEYVCRTLDKDIGSQFLGWTYEENSDEYITEPIIISKNTTIYAQYSEALEFETTSEYGKLAYYVDFDVAAGTAMKQDFGNGLDISNYTTFEAPAIAGMPAVVKMDTYSTSYYTDGDNLVVKGTNFPRFWFAAYEKDATTAASFPKGVYTVEWCGKSDHTAVNCNKVVVNGTDTSNSMWKSDNLGEAANATFKSEYATYKGTFTYDGTKVITASGNTVAHGGTKVTDMTGGLGRIGLYSPGDGYSAVPRYYKWVKIWYTPLTVNVTFDVNGMDVEGLGTKEVSSNFNPTDYTLDDCGTSRFAGWSLTKDGDLLTGTTVFAEDKTLYAVWDDYYYAPEDEDFNAGKLLALIHFNNVTATSNLNSQIVNYGTISNYGEGYNNKWIDSATGQEKTASGTKYPEVVISTEDNNANINQYPANIWINGRSTDTFKYNAENNGNQKHPDNEMVIVAHKDTAATIFYPKLAIHNNSFGSFADGIYTFAAEVYVPENDNITSVLYNAYASDKNNVESGTVGAKELAVGEKTYIKCSILICDGVAYDYDTMKPNVVNLSADKVTAVGFNFQTNLKEAVNDSPAIHADNFRIYFKPYDYAPRSYTENSIRIEGVSGIRFKSSVSTIERNNEQLTEYGFIVTLKDLLGDTDVNEFTHTTEVTKVEGKNYDTANNVDKIFEQNGNNFFFTAVVHNIPEGKYDMDLVVRPYTVVDGEYVYGDAMVNNIKAVAEKLVGSERYEADDDFRAAIDKFVANEAL